MIERVKHWWTLRSTRPREERAERRVNFAIRLSRSADAKAERAIDELLASFRAGDRWLGRRR